MQKIERFKAKTHAGGRLWLPSRLVNLIPEDTYFECELTEEGILFRRVTTPRLPKDLPSWTNGDAR